MADAWNENAIEFLRGQKTATVTLVSNSRLNTKVRKLAKDRPDECQITHENTDGSIVAHVPVKWVKISPPRVGREMTEEEKEAARQRLLEYRNRKKNEESSDVDIDDYDLDEDEDEDEDEGFDDFGDLLGDDE